MQENNTEAGYHVWQYGKKASDFKPSNENMSQVRKEMITRALHFDIRDVRTYAGYKGDLLIQITATDMLVLDALQKQAGVLKMQTLIKPNLDTMLHELYCIVPDDVYRLKEKK